VLATKHATEIKIMLRITATQTTDADPLLLLEGRLIGPWVDELQTAVDAIGEPLERVHLDLSNVRFVDPRGLALLDRLHHRRVVLAPMSRMVHALFSVRTV
jgi:ABC-type transporter Mla MlaB component